MKELILTLALDEANLVLNALGNLPYVKVHELITKMQAQAAEQMKSAGQDDVPVTYSTKEQ